MAPQAIAAPRRRRHTSPGRYLLVFALAGPTAAGPVLTLEDRIGTGVTVLLGSSDGSESAHTVSRIGDLNGDGVADLAIGAPLADHAGADSGSVFVLFGRAAGLPASIDLTALDGSDGFRLDGQGVGDNAGTDVAAAGDVNGDGRADLLIGAPFADGGENDIGRSYVVFGRASGSGFPATQSLGALSSAEGFAIDGASTADQSGRNVDGAGDFNDDGIADIIIGADAADPAGLESGAAYVVFGRSGVPGFGSGISLASLNGINGVRLTGFAAGQFTGSSVAGIGDFNGDGIDDVLVGADGLTSSAGGAHVVFGRSTAFAASLSLGTLDGSNGFRADGGAAFDFAGRAAGGSGDLDGDGRADAIVGAPRSDPNGGDSGTSYVLRGRAAPVATPLALGTLVPPAGSRLTGAAAFDFSAGSVAVVADVNGDALDDVLVGAAGYDRPGLQDAGAGFLVFGNAAGLPATLSLGTLDGANGVRLQSSTAGRNVGRDVAGAGDLNADGLPDLVLAAAARDTVGNLARARSFVVFGNAPPLSQPPRAANAPAVLEDTADPVALGVQASLGALYLDAQPMAGIGITEAPAPTNGTWQYRLAPGDAWSALPATLSGTAALVLANGSQLRFVPAPDYFGNSPPLRARLWDGADGHAPGTPRDIAGSIGSLGGFARDAEIVTLTVPVTAVNDAPSFALAALVEVLEDAGPQVREGHASAISAGAANEAGQTLGFELAALAAPSPPALAAGPAIAAANGRLTFTAAADSFGEATYRVVLADNGGTANGGADRSLPREFVLRVLPVNDAPDFTAQNPPPVLATAGNVTLPGWATFSPGPANESAQTASYSVTRVSNPALFQALPAVAADGALTYAPALGAIGTAQVDIVVTDSGGTANGGIASSSTRTFTFTVLASADGLFADGYEGN